jgi:hypothetical protein
VRKSCADWLTDVDRRLPTVVFRAQAQAQGGAGADVLDARLSLDGEPLPHGLDGAAIAVDPGEHVVHFERDGSAPIDERVVVAEGEKGRVITGRFASSTVATVPVGSQASSPRKAESLVPLILGGVGVVGVAGFVYFGVTAKGDLDHLRSTCAPYCSGSQLGSVKGEALAADVSLGVGIVALGAAAYLFFSYREVPPVAAMIDVRPEPGGASAQVRARF